MPVLLDSFKAPSSPHSDAKIQIKYNAKHIENSGIVQQGHMKASHWRIMVVNLFLVVIKPHRHTHTYIYCHKKTVPTRLVLPWKLQCRCVKFAFTLNQQSYHNVLLHQQIIDFIWLPETFLKVYFSRATEKVLRHLRDVFYAASKPQRFLLGPWSHQYQSNQNSCTPAFLLVIYGELAHSWRKWTHGGQRSFFSRLLSFTLYHFSLVVFSTQSCTHPRSQVTQIWNVSAPPAGFGHVFQAADMAALSYTHTHNHYDK